MVLYECYFCDFTTKYITNFKNHITKIKKCTYLIRYITIDNIEDYNKIVELHKTEPENQIWGKDVPRIIKCEYCNHTFTRTHSLTRHKKNCNKKYLSDVLDLEIPKKCTNIVDPCIELLKNSTFVENELEDKTRFKCEYCNKTYKTKQLLKRHEKVCDRKGMLDFLETI